MRCVSFSRSPVLPEKDERFGAGKVDQIERAFDTVLTPDT